MFYNDDLINEIKDKNDIVEVISSYTTLKKSGTNYVGLCPFHSEKTPSFHVSADKQMYYCFGCGAGGTVINFIEGAENLDFLETIAFLAQRAGITLPENGGEESEESKLKKKILEMNKIAGRAYFKSLNSENGFAALSYLRGRGLTDSTITTYGLGYAPNSFNFIYNILKSKGYRDSDIVKSGLCVNKNGRIFDFFRNRVMFPVMDVRGNVIAFGGRDLGDGMPKYLNTGETAVFKKRNNLFNLNIAKNKKDGYLILAEGYMDVISLYQAGFQNAVASLGTSFAQEHARLIKKYTDKVIISYDSDSAGRNAAVKAANILKNEDIRVKVLKMQGAKDPDELIKKFGAEAYREALNSSLSSVEFDLEGIYPKEGFTDEEEKVEYVKKAAEILKFIKSPLELEVYAKKTAQLAGISYEQVIAYVNDKKKREKRIREINFEKNLSVRKRNPEDTLVKIIVENPQYFSKIRDKIKVEDFKKNINSKIFRIFSEYVKNGVKCDVSMICSRLEKEEVGEAGRLFIEKEPVGNFEEFFESLIKKVKENREREENAEKIKSGGNEEDLLEYAKLLREKEIKRKNPL